jgi:pimeloyl-ACP methyl ester carboxylesterase
MINLIAIGDALGGVMGPSDLYEELSKSPFPSVFLLSRVDIACPHDGTKFLLTPTKHFEYAVERIQEVATTLYATNGQAVVLMGWAMGGAVAIEAAYRLQQSVPVHGIITLACQRRCTENLKHLHPHMFKCFLHGSLDNSLPATISEKLYEDAPFFINKDSWCVKHILPNGDHRFSDYIPQLQLFIPQILQHVDVLFKTLHAATQSSTSDGA